MSTFPGQGDCPMVFPIHNSGTVVNTGPGHQPVTPPPDATFRVVGIRAVRLSDASVVEVTVSLRGFHVATVRMTPHEARQLAAALRFEATQADGKVIV